jgi:hypothetical protein
MVLIKRSAVNRGSACIAAHTAVTPTPQAHPRHLAHRLAMLQIAR